MAKIISKNKLLVIAILCFSLVASYSNVFAWGGHGGRGYGGGRYHYRGGRWYSPGWFGFDVAVSALAIGAVVEGLPGGYTTVIVGGVPYYSYGGYYYRQYPYGYVVVPEPVVASVYAPTPEATPAIVTQLKDKATIVNIPNSKGGYTPVTLTKHKNGYIGPQGEYYEGRPTVEQLKVLYGN